MGFFTDPTKGIPLQLLGYFKVKTGLKVTGSKVGRDHNDHTYKVSQYKTDLHSDINSLRQLMKR